MKVSPRKKFKDIPSIFAASNTSSLFKDSNKLKQSILSLIKKKPTLEIDIESPSNELQTSQLLEH